MFIPDQYDIIHSNLLYSTELLFSSSTETNTSLNLAIIIGASAGGGGLILLALFVIVCRACLVTRRKETKKQLQ